MVEPGPDLDELVAEKVMGLALEWNQETRCAYCGGEMRYCGGRSWCCGCGEWRFSPYKEYSTDIAAGWEPVPAILSQCKQELEDKGYSAEFALEYALDWWDEGMANRGPRWWAFFGRYEDCGEINWAHEAESLIGPAHAIYLAALKAKGVEVE